MGYSRLKALNVKEKLSRVMTSFIPFTFQAELNCKIIESVFILCLEFRIRVKSFVIKCSFEVQLFIIVSYLLDIKRLNSL